MYYQETETTDIYDENNELIETRTTAWRTINRRVLENNRRFQIVTDANNNKKRETELTWSNYDYYVTKDTYYQPQGTKVTAQYELTPKHDASYDTTIQIYDKYGNPKIVLKRMNSSFSYDSSFDTWVWFMADGVTPYTGEDFTSLQM